MSASIAVRYLLLLFALIRQSFFEKMRSWSSLFTSGIHYHETSVRIVSYMRHYFGEKIGLSMFFAAQCSSLFYGFACSWRCRYHVFALLLILCKQKNRILLSFFTFLQFLDGIIVDFRRCTRTVSMYGFFYRHVSIFVLRNYLHCLFGLIFCIYVFPQILSLKIQCGSFHFHSSSPSGVFCF